MKVKFSNLDFFKKRADQRTMRWFSFPINIFREPDFMCRFNSDDICALCYCASNALNSENEEFEINYNHVRGFTGLEENTFNQALEKLEQNQFIEIIRNETVTNTLRIRNEHVTKPLRTRNETGAYITEHNITGKGGVGEKHDTLYPKEILGIAEILKARSVSNSLATKWVSIYDPRKICREVEKAESWLLAGKRTKKNYGLFFNNWLSRSEKSNSPSPEKKSDESRSTQVETKKSWYALEMEKKQKGLPNCLDGSQKSEVEIAQEKEFGSSGV